MSLGPGEIVVLFILGLLVFGPKKLPEVGRTLGEVLRDLKRMSSDVTSAFEDAMQDKPERSKSHEWDDVDTSYLTSTPEGEAAKDGAEVHSEAAPYETDGYRRNAGVTDESVAENNENRSVSDGEDVLSDAEELAVHGQEVEYASGEASDGAKEAMDAERTHQT